MPGPLHFGKYVLLDKIGTGGMAELYLAKQTGLKGFEKVIAIKRILPHLTQDSEFVNMFINEAKLAALLSHQNIVQIYDLGHVEGMYYIAMEYLMGKDLRTVLRKRNETQTLIPIELALMITSRICSALDYAHRKKDFSGNDLNIVHRDVSPQNILISYEGEVKLVDFGIAKAASTGAETRAGVLKGKLAYMSPEQAWGKTIDRRSDVFATGVVLYEMLAGERPFRGTNDFELLEKVRQAEPQPLSTLNPDVSPELEAILKQAMAKDPAQRYRTSSEFEVALEHLVVSKGYGLSSLNLSQYMSALFKQEMEVDTQRFHMATRINLEETRVDRPIHRATDLHAPAGTVQASEATRTSQRTTPTSRRVVSQQRSHPYLNFLFLFGLILLIAAPVFVYFQPDLLLRTIGQYPWLQHLENPVRYHLENLDLIRSESPARGPTPTANPVALATHPGEASLSVPSGTAPSVESSAFPEDSLQTGHESPSGPDPDVPSPEKPVALTAADKIRLRTLLVTANRQYEERDLDGLEKTLRRIIQVNPRTPRAYHMLGTVYLERKEDETAFRIFSEAVNMFPGDPMLHHDLGYLYYKRGYYDLARQEFSRALEISPSFPKAEQSRNLLMSIEQTGHAPLAPVIAEPSPPESPDVIGDAPQEPVPPDPQSDLEP